MKRVWVLLLVTTGLPSHIAAQCPDGSPPPCRPARLSTAPPPNSVAVLYFDNVSLDTADVYLADGLTEALMARLGRIDRLVVKSRAAVARYRRVPGDPLSIARTLGVATFVDGNVRRVGHRLRIIAELVRASTGDRLWIEIYDRSDADLLGVEDEIAREVATAVVGRLDPAERTRLTRHHTTSAGAYDHYLRGNYALAQRNPRAAARAIEEYATAESLDSHFAEAIGREAFAYSIFVVLGWTHPTLPTDTLLARGMAATDRALREDSTASDAWMARGFLLVMRARSSPLTVREAFARAVTLDPANAEAWQLDGMSRFAFGDDSGAAASLEHALTLEPDRPITLTRLGEVRYVEKRFAEAAHWLDSAVAVDPGFYIAYADRALVRQHLDDLSDARSDAELAVRLSVGDSLPGVTALTIVLTRSGDTTAARARFSPAWRAIAARATEADLVNAAAALIALGDRDSALALLDRLPDLPHRTSWTWSSLQFPEFDALRNIPRFQRVEAALRPSIGP